MFSLLISKQSDHDLDLLPLWYSYYTSVHPVDEIVITPVLTEQSTIGRVLDFYRNKPVKVVPMRIQRWNADQVWNAQLQLAAKLLEEKNEYLVLSADADQFFEPLDEEPKSPTQVYSRVNVVSSDTPMPESPSAVEYQARQTERLVAGFVNTLQHPSMQVTGHFEKELSPEEIAALPREFHINLRGYDHFLRKVQALAVQSDGSPRSWHWKKWRAALESGGEDALRQEYSEWAAHLLQGESEPTQVDALKELFSKITPVEKNTKELELEHIYSLISKIASEGYHDGSSLAEGVLYHPIPYPEFNRIPAHKNEAPAELEAIVKSGEQFDGKSLLEVGCANGFFTFVAAQKAARVVAFEGDPTVNRVTKAVAEYKELSNVEIVPMYFNSEELSMIQGDFDIALMLNVHMWLHKQLGSDALREVMGQLAKRVKVLYFQTAHAESGGDYLVTELADQAAIEAYLRDCGFPNITLLRTTAGHGGIRHLFRAATS